jgi:hypothetical protein
MAASLRELSEIEIGMPAWAEYRAALADALHGGRWLPLTDFIGGITLANQVTERLANTNRGLDDSRLEIQLRTALAESRLEKQLRQAAYHLDNAAAGIPMGLEALQPLIGVTRGTHEGILQHVRDEQVLGRASDENDIYSLLAYDRTPDAANEAKLEARGQTPIE